MHARNLPVIITILGDISYPWYTLIPTLLYDLEIPYLYARYGIIRDLISNADRTSFISCNSL